MDGELHARIRVLHAKRGAIATEATVGEHVFLGEVAGIDFDGNFRFRGQVECAADNLVESVDFRGRKKRGRAAAEMELRDGPE
ncbi:MAG: hypothetical protein NVV74_10110 [Magnetospirillum sp.]|nr:hypothetical protein [Magnetospirillum sp.]